VAKHLIGAVAEGPRASEQFAAVAAAFVAGARGAAGVAVSEGRGCGVLLDSFVYTGPLLADLILIRKER